MALLLYFAIPMLLGSSFVAAVIMFEGHRLSDPRMVKMGLAVAVGLFGIVGAITVVTDEEYLSKVAAWFASRPPCPTPKPGEYAMCARP